MGSVFRKNSDKKYKLMQEDDSEEKISRIYFLSEQFSLIFKKQKRYSSKVIINAIKKMLGNAEIE
jgi:hypothetical protein